MFSASRFLRVAQPVCRRTTTNVLAPSSLRFMHNTTVLQQAPAAPVKSESVVTDTIEKYGVAPLLGLGAIAILSKECFVVDAEFFLALDMCLAVFTGYVVAGDSVNKHFEEVHERETTNVQNSFDAAIASVEAYKASQENLLKEIECIKEYQGEWVAAEEAFCAYQTVAPKHEVYKATVAKLEAVKAVENQQEKIIHQNMVAGAIAAVEMGFEDQKTRDEMITLAISSIGNEPDSTEANDPVKRIMLQYFAAEGAAADKEDL